MLALWQPPPDFTQSGIKRSRRARRGGRFSIRLSRLSYLRALDALGFLWAGGEVSFSGALDHALLAKGAA